MMTDQQFTDWLNDPNTYYTFLIEAKASVNGVDKTFYMSTDGYGSGQTDTLANVTYEAIATLGTLFTEQVSLDGSDSSIGQGQLQISNIDGVRDIWRTYVWANKNITIFVGDVRWSRNDFRQMFVGKIADLKPSGANAFVINLRDKMQQLNQNMTELKLGGTTQNKDAIVPIPLGELWNVSPLQEDPSTLSFRVGQGQCNYIFEVRDNGVPLTGASAPTIDLINSRIKLTATPLGTITVSMQGDAPSGVYTNTCAGLIKYVVKTYGNALTRFTDADIDLANFSAFDLANQQPMGRYVSDKDNVLTVCRDLASSLGTQMCISTITGKLRLVQVGLPTGTPVVVTSADMDERSLEPDNSPDVVAAFKLNFCKNWTPQDQGTLGGIPQEHKDLYSQDSLTTTQIDANVQLQYTLPADPTEIDTMLSRRVDADAEASRRLAFWKVPRTVYYFNGYPKFMMLELGTAIKVFHRRYQMQNGVTGMVVSIARDWKNRRVKIGFIV